MTDHVLSAPTARATPRKAAGRPSHKILSVCTLSSGRKRLTEIGVTGPTGLQLDQANAVVRVKKAEGMGRRGSGETTEV